ncbi:MAG: HAMP domain-containing histidine kinase [Phycisphaerales bacterium]|nr:HAMP domain-containing histidine kinase [Phycisphaerales bacterium]
MNAPDPIPPFHRQGDATDPQQPLPRSITRVDSGPAQIDRVAALVHELDNLLDGSLRCVGLAVRTLNAESGAVGLSEIDSVRHQLETAAKALERMAGLVHAAMRGRSYSIGSLTTDDAPTVSLRDAIEHAADVMRLSAQQHHTTISVEVDPDIADCPSGPLYSALLNGIKNAVESVVAVGGRGAVQVTCRVEATATSRSRVPGSTTRWVRINIADDGAGLARGVPASKLFNAGFSTKPDGHGIGLALTRSILERMGGHAELSARDDTSSRRPGAVLTLRFPLTEQGLDQRKVG